MQVKALGAAKEVGRSAFLLNADGKNVLLDFGVLIRREPSFPMHVQPREVDAVVLSHAHLDHSGAVPLFYLSNGVETYCTGPTAELANLLLEDFVKISTQVNGYYLPFEYLEVEAMFRNSRRVSLDEEFRLGNLTLKFINAGHMPGSASIMVEGDGKRLLYTGDINSSSSHLLDGASTDYGELDALITETTYGLNDHPPREEVEVEFVSFAREVVERGGTLLVPAFSVGRAQEMACVLNAKNFPYPVAMDGMALKANEILLRYQEYLSDASFFRRTLEGLHMIAGWKERKSIIGTPSVIIAPAGMMVGGAAVFYNSELSQNSKNGIAIVSFQIPGTPGRTLLEKGITVVNGKQRKVKAEVRRFDFSSHSGSTELFEMVQKTKGSPKVVTVHGEEQQSQGFADRVKEKLGLEAITPSPGDVIEI